MFCTIRHFHLRFALSIFAVLLLLAPPSATAHEPKAGISEIEQLWQQANVQQAELDDLKAQIYAQHELLSRSSFAPLPLNSDKTELQREREPAKDEPGFEVGSDLRENLRWDVVKGIVFETPNKDFISHFGFRMNLDLVRFQETNGLQQSAGFGPLEDGMFFRRIRPSWDGVVYDIVEFQAQIALEQTDFNVPNLNEMWAGLKEIPLFGTVRIGHMKIAQGFEAGQFSSDRLQTFLEKSSFSEALLQTFGTGVFVTNNAADEHITWAAQAYKQDSLNNNIGADFANGAFGYTGRLTVLPFYQDEGRHLLHLGVSGTYRVTQPTSVGGPGVTDFRARPEMRDQIGTTPLGNSNRLVDTGVIRSDANSVIGSELFYILGPASLQAEYNWATIDDAVVNNVQRGNLPFQGGYVKLSYFLTGENRMYDRRFGRLGPNYSNGPYTPFWLVRDGNGDCCWGSGAWEIAARYSYLNLDDRAISGGKTEGYAYGLNWYLNPSLSIRTEYLHQNVFGGGPNPDGVVDGFGIRTQFFF